VKLGTEESRIRLVPDNVKREALEQATGLGRSGDVNIELSRMKPPQQAFDLYLKNLVRNPRLDADDIRLGFLLFDLLEHNLGSQSFLLIPMSDFHMSQIGENGVLYFHGTRNCEFGYDFLEKQSLLDIANKCRLDLDTSHLIRLLNRLHSFFYITCTELCEENLAVNRIGFKYTKEEVLLSKDAKIVHIRLNERFNKIDLTKRWGKSTK